MKKNFRIIICLFACLLLVSCSTEHAEQEQSPVNKPNDEVVDNIDNQQQEEVVTTPVVTQLEESEVDSPNKEYVKQEESKEISTIVDKEENDIEENNVIHWNLDSSKTKNENKREIIAYIMDDKISQTIHDLAININLDEAIKNGQTNIQIGTLGNNETIVPLSEYNYILNTTGLYLGYGEAPITEVVEKPTDSVEPKFFIENNTFIDINGNKWPLMQKYGKTYINLNSQELYDKYYSTLTLDIIFEYQNAGYSAFMNTEPYLKFANPNVDVFVYSDVEFVDRASHRDFSGEELQKLLQERKIVILEANPNRLYVSDNDVTTNRALVCAWYGNSKGDPSIHEFCSEYWNEATRIQEQWNSN